MKKLFYSVLGLVSLAGCNEVKIGEDFTEKAVPGVEIEMVYVKGGTFTMGTPGEQENSASFSDEQPVHQVTLSDYYIGKYEVTQELWSAVMGTTVEDQRNKTDKSWSLRGVAPEYPIYYVNWDEAQEFCSKLSQLTGKKYVLPTEAQWEYAARGGAKSKGYEYSGSSRVGEVAWYGERWEKGSTHPVGIKQPNELGIYDMSGNVWEWCSDWYGHYSAAAQTNPQGPASGQHRVLRGGAWGGSDWLCRVADRFEDHPGYRYYYFGFRIALIP